MPPAPPCNPVEVDATFACDVKVSGETKKVTIKITKEDGAYAAERCAGPVVPTRRASRTTFAFPHSLRHGTGGLN
ncbi:DUF4333 domain-containing protein [Nocardia brasiliensis]|uniref:DUF4333 domain-containing protein n=1 Tax=Nocardia brasiliensis TaxID=37326 RepID=UPI002454F40A|nr:DUF4333 domain-containing protein [Nocardia brasiliensis]